MKKSKRILAILIASFMIISALSALAVCFAAAPGGNNEAVLGRDFIDYQPIPLLVIKVNFDVDGDGKDCYEILDENGERSLAFDRKYMPSISQQVGEQYCYSPDSYWAETCFGESRGSLNDYYKYISNGRFYWIPVEETSGTVNDGVITVTVNDKHPGVNDKEGLSSGGERRHAIEAADQFVDFSKYDKDGSGDIDFTELSIIYVYGGNEISYAVDETMQYVYNTHAHVSQASFGGLVLDGVGVWSKGTQRYVRVGENRGAGGKWARMGKLAHELGHVLNAKDLYTNKPSWIGGCGELSLMGGGSGGSNGGNSYPTVLDPYYKVLYGFADEEVASSEKTEYTLYSHESTKGEFNVIRINTPNPKEYYLIENRSHASDGYDNNGLNGNMQGVLIWHIDEGIINSTARPNNGDEGHAAGFTVITPINNIQDADENSTWSSKSASTVFVANSTAQYKFPVSNSAQNPGTWYTAMTEEEAAKCDIKIEFLTEPGDEMTVRITGANDLAAEFNAAENNKTQTSMSVGATVTDFNGAAVENCKIYFADNKNMENAKEVVAEKLKIDGVEVPGKYMANFDGLTPSTQYYFKVEITTAHGTSTKTGAAYTLAVPVEDTTAKVTIIIKSDIQEKTTQNIKVGGKLRINFPLTKAGYTFGGWYLDEAYTKPFDPEKTIESADDFTIYAKWNANQTEAPTTAPDSTTGEMPNGTVSGGCGGSVSTTADPMLVGGAVTAILGAAAGGKLFGRKRKSDSEEK
jgi:M6 family metalloprotease-like protein/uncharacterized repeat protein (TIGR02543 family)